MALVAEDPKLLSAIEFNFSLILFGGSFYLAYSLMSKKEIFGGHKGKIVMASFVFSQLTKAAFDALNRTAGCQIVIDENKI